MLGKTKKQKESIVANIIQGTMLGLREFISSGFREIIDTTLAGILVDTIVIIFPRCYG